MLVAATIAIVGKTTGQPVVNAVARAFGVGQITAPPWRCPLGPSSVPHRRVLVLYDSTGQYAAYGAQSAALAANFASHFAQPVRQPVRSYRPGEMKQFAAVVYVGTNYGEPLPHSFLADVRAGERPVLWLGGNAYQLTTSRYARMYGWREGADHIEHFVRVRYRDTDLTINNNDLTGIDILNHGKVAVLGTAMTKQGKSVPWAIRSRKLTYISEAPLASGGSKDRSFAFADLLASLFGDNQQGHVALLRLEDIGPETSPAQLRKIGELLASQRIPYSVAVYPMYLGPANQHPRLRVALKDQPAVVEALRYMMANGATLVLHGYTHQLGDSPNPNNGESGEDYEFLRVHYNAKKVLLYANPVPRHSVRWARHRIELALAGIRAAGLPRPALWQFPEYGATPAEYRLAASMFVARYERGNYAMGTAGHEDLQSLTEQTPPYLVHDVYGGPVLPETLGYVTVPYERSVRAIVAAAAVQKAVVRDNVGSVYYHPFLGTALLRQLVDGMRKDGYHFVSPCAVLKG